MLSATSFRHRGQSAATSCLAPATAAACWASSQRCERRLRQPLLQSRLTRWRLAQKQQQQQPTLQQVREHARRGLSGVQHCHCSPCGPSAPLSCAGTDLQPGERSQGAPPAVASPASDSGGTAAPDACSSVQLDRDSIYVSTAQAMSMESASPQPSTGRALSFARQPTAGSLTPSAQAAVLGLRSPAAGKRASVGLRAPWATYEVLISPCCCSASAAARRGASALRGTVADAMSTMRRALSSPADQRAVLGCRLQRVRFGRHHRPAPNIDSWHSDALWLLTNMLANSCTCNL